MIRNHKSDIFTDDDDVFHITIRRGHVFEDALRTFRTDGEWEQKPLKVTFFDEPAVDYGGPRREFFTILLKSIASNGSILDGNGNRRTLRHNTTAFQVRT